MKMLVEANTTPPERWLNEKEVAAMTGMSVHTLRSHRQKRCGIPYAKFGSSVRYSEVVVRNHMSSCQITF